MQSRPDEHLRNIAVNFWFDPYMTKEFPCPTCRLYVSPDYPNFLRDQSWLGNALGTRAYHNATGVLLDALEFSPTLV